VLFSLASSSVFLPLYRFFDIAFFWFSFLIWNLTLKYLT
jgi:hypothetical protein